MPARPGQQAVHSEIAGTGKHPAADRQRRADRGCGRDVQRAAGDDQGLRAGQAVNRADQRVGDRDVRGKVRDDDVVARPGKRVGAPVERLLKQMKDAGLKHSAESEAVSDSEKQTLLAFLKGSHGESADEPKKITLKRKTTTTLKIVSGSNRKTVNVEVRKKRTYIKRDDIEAPVKLVVVESEAVVEAAVVEEVPVKSVLVDDIEQKRIAAHMRRNAEKVEQVEGKKEEEAPEVGKE